MRFVGLYAHFRCRPLCRRLLEIHDSVLWYFAQCLIYAGSAVGIDVLIDERIKRNRDS